MSVLKNIVYLIDNLINKIGLVIIILAVCLIVGVYAFSHPELLQKMLPTGKLDFSDFS